METDKLIEKWLRNELTTEELTQFEQLDDFSLNTKIIEGAKAFKASQFSKPPSIDKFQKNLVAPSKVIPLNPIKFFSRIAAILIVAIGVYFAFSNMNITTIQTLASEQTEFELPDASTVALNATSKIKFDKKKWATNRSLTLQGEAFFKVAKGSKFDVKTADGIISVLGTQFTVKQRTNYFEVQCFEGLVSVLHNNKTYKLSQGKTYRFVHGETLLSTSDKKSPDWLRNITTFESVPMIEVLNELERQYAISIKSDKEINSNRIFTGGFVNNNLEQALQSISVPLNLVFKKESDNKYKLSNKTIK